MARDLTDGASTVTDGRTARRERGKLAVVEAVLGYIEETDGHGEATPDEIARRAGVSVASLFRYFGTLDEMRHAAAQHWLEENAHLLTIRDTGVGSLEVRIKNFVETRLASFAAGRPIMRLLTRLSSENEAAATAVRGARTMARDQVRHHFDTEISRLSPDQADNVVAIIATLASYSALIVLTEHDDMELADVATPLESALTCILGSARGPKS